VICMEIVRAVFARPLQCINHSSHYFHGRTMVSKCWALHLVVTMSLALGIGCIVQRAMRVNDMPAR
jgi:hypothetical protein